MFDFIERFKSFGDRLEIDFCRWRFHALAVSGVLCLASLLAFVFVGPNWSTDFTGGTEIRVKFEDQMDIGDLRRGLKDLGLADDAVQSVGGSDSGEFLIRIGDPQFGMEGLEEDVRKALGGLYGEGWIEQIQGRAEVSARFDVKYTGEPMDWDKITTDLQAAFPGARAAPGQAETEVSIEIPGLDERITDQIQAEFPGHAFKVLATDSVGPRVGEELRRNGLIALLATMGLILVYVAFRFDLEFAPGAVIAVVHDVLLTVGVFVVFQLDFSLATLGALLTILGYSINDTIVIYDRIRENRERYRKSELIPLINKSVSETLSRTLATNTTVFLAILAFLVWGGPVLRDFAIAMLCGQIFGTYSTIYIASPLVIWFQDLKPWFAKLIVVSDLGTEEPTAPISGDDGMGPPLMTESEKRRRARAEAEKRDPSSP